MKFWSKFSNLFHVGGNYCKFNFFISVQTNEMEYSMYKQFQKVFVIMEKLSFAFIY